MHCNGKHRTHKYCPGHSLLEARTDANGLIWDIAWSSQFTAGLNIRFVLLLFNAVQDEVDTLVTLFFLDFNFSSSSLGYFSHFVHWKDEAPLVGA